MPPRQDLKRRVRRILRAGAIVLTAPLHLPAVFSWEKGFTNPLLGSVRLNRWGLHAWRVSRTHRLAARRRRALESLVSPEDRRAFEANGFIVKPDVLPQATFEALKAQVLALELPAREMIEGDAVTRQISVTDEVLKAAPALRALLDLPAWRGTIAYVGSFDVAPLVNIQTILAKAVEGPIDPQTQVHMDTFHPIAKAWLFLEDVGPDDGPFTYVPGSHRIDRRRLAWQKRRSILKSKRGQAGGSLRVSTRQLATLRLPPPVQVTVRANTLVVADTFGFHARTPSSRPTRRVEIYASLRANPFSPFARLGPSSLRPPQGLKERIGWLGTDLLVALRLERPIWSAAGPRRPKQGLTPETPSDQA